jgi:hypothetical protein
MGRFLVPINADLRVTMPIKKVKIKKEKRPNGLSLERYRGHENWSYRRWAWEFLRRDDDFIHACTAVDNKEKTEQEIAEKFHLLHFKHCDAAFKSQKSPPPRFTVSTIKKRANLNSDEAGEARVENTVALAPGQVWLRFDLNHEFLVGGSIEAQLRVAKRSLNIALLAYAEAIRKTPNPTKKPEGKSFLELLRRLDAVAGHDVGVKGLAGLQPGDFESLKSGERSKKAASLMRTPREYAKEVYLSLAVHASK